MVNHSPTICPFSLIPHFRWVSYGPVAASALQMTRWWMSSKPRLLRSDFLSIRSIKAQSLNCSPAYRADAQRSDTIPTEVQSPRLPSWVEKGNFLASSRINCLLSRSFAERTRNARQRQIAQLCGSRRVQWDYVINVERCLLALLGKPAVFTAVPGTLSDLCAKMRRNEHVIRPPYGLGVLPADGAAKGRLRVQPSPRPRAAQKRSIACLDLVCRATSANVCQPPLEAGILPGRRVTRFQTGFALTYSLKRCAEVTQRRLVSPNKNAFFLNCYECSD
jgi:hypothetical protein